MAKNLIIIESPGKIKKYKSILGKEYEILASIGHIYDLSKSKLGIDIKNNFAPTYEIMPDKKDVFKNILTQAKKASTIYLMMDPDREGSGIAQNIFNHFTEDIQSRVRRAVTNSITHDAILNAIKSSYDMSKDLPLVDAYEARRMLDRIVGFKCSFLTTQATGGKSAGRVQSAGLRVISEREKEIKSFVPIKYYNIDAELITKDYKKINARITTPKPLEINTEDLAIKICDTFKNNDVIVSAFDKKENFLNAYAPFTTASLLQSASGVLGWNSDRTTKIAQSLYQKGLCTYIRTDSTFIVPEAIADTRNYITDNYGDKYVSASVNFFGQQKNAQEAHEAIRPTSISAVDISGTTDEKRLYELIWKRTVASQMSPSKNMSIRADFKSKEYILSANGHKCLFDGWKKVWNYALSDDQLIPDIKVGDKVNVLEIQHEEKETQPPSRYTESSFIKKMKDLGIGRPSTYNSIITTLKQRGYIEESKKSLCATDMGIAVSDFLIASNFCFIDLMFTANMEGDLDEIASGVKDKLAILKTFWKRLKEDIDNAKNVKNDKQHTGLKCPKCNGELLEKFSKFGKFFACERYNDKNNKCSYTASVGDDGKPVEKKAKEIIYSEYECPVCKSKMVEREGKYGKFYGCSKYGSTKCNGMRDSEGNTVEYKKKQYKKTYKKKKGK